MRKPNVKGEPRLTLKDGIKLVLKEKIEWNIYFYPE